MYVDIVISNIFYLTKHFFFLLVAPSSQNGQLSQFPARCWREAFHATFIHNIQGKGEHRIGWRSSLGTPISTTTTTHHNYHYLAPTNQLLQIKRWAEESREEKPQKTQSHSHSCSVRSRPVI